MFGKPEWFLIKAGKHVGQPHLSGWKGSALKTGDDVGEWTAIAHCPLCGAMVETDSHSYGDMSWQHEQWHARTDFPIPDGLLDSPTE